MKSISKSQVASIIQSCIDGELSAAGLQEWMVFNYDPPDVEIGLSEQRHTVEAMNIVMNEYELADPEKFKELGYKLALEFISCSEHDFESTRRRFIHDGFED